MIAKHLTLAVCGLLLGMACVEVVLRIADPQVEVVNPLRGFHDGDTRLGWRGKPNVTRRFHRSEFDVLVEHGPDGFRRAAPPASENAAARVLFLGDSFTWGWGVSQGEVFTDHLQRALPGVGIDNRGVNGFGTGQEYLLLQELLRRQRYARVAVMFFNNDLSDNAADKEHRPRFALVGGRPMPQNLPLPASLKDPVGAFLDDHLRAVQFFSFQFAMLKERFRSGRGAHPEPTPSREAIDYRTLPGYELTVRLLDQMRVRSRNRGATFFVVYVPSRSEIEHQPAADAEMRAVHELIVETCRGLDIPLVDLVPAFHAAAARGERLIFARDEHWNPAGHRLAAKTILASPLFDGLRGDSAPAAE